MTIPERLRLMLFVVFTNASVGIAYAGDLPRETVFVERDTQSIRFSVEVADTSEARAKGLMFRTVLPSDEGMLFVYTKPQVVSMWMKNTLISLDMLFISEAGKIVHIVENTTPHSLKTISSKRQVTMVLELAAGAVKASRIGIGDRIRRETGS